MHTHAAGVKVDQTASGGIDCRVSRERNAVVHVVDSSRQGAGGKSVGVIPGWPASGGLRCKSTLVGTLCGRRQPCQRIGDRGRIEQYGSGNYPAAGQGRVITRETYLSGDDSRIAVPLKCRAAAGVNHYVPPVVDDDLVG